MAEFPIEYSRRLPSGQTTAVQAPLETGEYEALAGLGAGITRIGSDLQNQKNMLEYSEGQRKIEEQVNAAMDSLTGDEEADAAVWENLQKDIGGVQYKNSRVNNQLEVYRNQRMPDFQQSLNKRHESLLKKNVHDMFEAEGQTFLAKGDVVGYQDLLDRRLVSKDISPAEYDAMSKSALGDSLLQQSRDLMASDSGVDRNRAVGILSNLPDIEGINLSTEQKEYRNRLLKLAKNSSQETIDETISSVVIQKDNLRNASALEKSAAAQDMKQTLVNGGVSGDKLNQWFGILDEWAGGNEDPTEQYDPQTYAGLQAACDLSPKEISEGQIYSFVGNGKDGGITIQQAKSLAELRKRNLDETRMGSIQKELHQRYQGILKGMYRADMFGTGPDAATNYAETANKLTVFANTNPNATTTDFEDYFARLTAEKKQDGWILASGKWFGTHITGLSPIRLIGYLNEVRQVANNVIPTFERQREIRQRIQSESLQRMQQREVGRVVTVKGQQWRIVRKGETPDQDVYERVE